ncbi:ABC transporter permease [Acerihabitans sp. TG2]|uniref:ABC transporter permease n=1 Tax=Acerihabitans sp. TG2 TaxID=3096008 RepID=UPI002B22E29B|nr:ABC transporter permease [Acerihabitans sp. TG2]MEA9391026.1 ABC transporter permease [Acerihabitans sp. TG2]
MTEMITAGNEAGHGSTLMQQLHQSQKKHKRRTWLLVAPLLLFIGLSFVVPIASVLVKSVANPELRTAMPTVTAALSHWDGNAIPDDSTFQALVSDLRSARASGQISSVAKRLSYEDPSYRSLIMHTLRAAPDDITQPGATRTALTTALPLWRNIDTWRSVQRASRPFTALYLLAVFDRKVDIHTGAVTRLPDDKALYVNVLERTLLMAGVVTLLCLVLGYPLAYWLSKQPAGRANLLMIMVLLPFWTSLIVRTASWIVLLQSGGLINGGLIHLGIIDKPLELVFNRIGVYIAMTHILLPFIVLPLYAVMKGISPNYMRAAISLGAHPFVAFWRVYVPQTYAGVAAGGLLVFIMAIGYYITPALLGGPGDQMLSYFVAFFTNTTMNWGMAAALGSQLLVIVIMLYLVYIRVTRTQAEIAAR